MTVSAIMKSCIVSLFLLLAVSGSWATFLHPFMQFSLQPPQQQFFYNPPQRNIAQEQFLFFPQLRSQFPSHYQSFNYIQTERHPYHLYNAPAAPRYPLYPNYRQTYNPVVEYIYQQTPLETVTSNMEYGEKVPKPVLKDYDEVIEMELEPAMITREPEKIPNEHITKEMVASPTLQMEVKPTVISEQLEEIKTTSEQTTKEITANPMSLQSELEPMLISKQPEEIRNEQATENPMNLQSESKSAMISKQLQQMETTSEQIMKEMSENDTTSPSESESTASVEQRVSEEVTGRSTEETKTDAMSLMEDSPSESTILAQ